MLCVHPERVPLGPSPLAEHGTKHQPLAGAPMPLEGKVSGFGEQLGEPQLWTKGVKSAYEKEGLGQMGLESKGGKSLFTLNLIGRFG